MVNSSSSSPAEQRKDDLVFSYLNKIEDFITADKQRRDTFSNYIKQFSDLKCSLVSSSSSTTAPLSVHVRGFEPEQIYQQLKSINESRLKPFIAAIVKSKAKPKTFGDLLRAPSPEPPVTINDDVEEEDNEEVSESPVPVKAPKKKKSVTFFDSGSLTKFLDEQDVQEISSSAKKTNRYDDEDDEDDDDLSLDAGEEQTTYDDFFDPPSESKAKNKKKKEKVIKKKEELELDQPEEEEEEEEDDDDETNLEGKSDFEKQQIHLKRQISSIEKEMLSAKPWQLTGETDAHKRPENSLLEEYIQFDRNARLPPVITTETTDTIEQLVKQRIRDKAFDDVERKKKTPGGDEARAYKKEIVLEHEKSKMSLAQVYEQEYVKKQTHEETEKKDERHETIRRMLQDLFVDLDALSNFRFTPRPPVPEVTVINNLPAILVEEVIPSTVNDATLLAPEEVHTRPKGDVKADTELTTTDKKHARRLLKHKLKLKAKDQPKKAANAADEAQEEKRTLLKKLGKMKNVRIEKTDKHRSNGKVARSSTKFFEQLQQSTSTTAIPTKKRRRPETTATDSKRLKL